MKKIGGGKGAGKERGNEGGSRQGERKTDTKGKREVEGEMIHYTYLEYIARYFIDNLSPHVQIETPVFT